MSRVLAEGAAWETQSSEIIATLISKSKKTFSRNKFAKKRLGAEAVKMLEKTVGEGDLLNSVDSTTLEH